MFAAVKFCLKLKKGESTRIYLVQFLPQKFRIVTEWWSVSHFSIIFPKMKNDYNKKLDKSGIYLCRVGQKTGPQTHDYNSDKS